MTPIGKNPSPQPTDKHLSLMLRVLFNRGTDVGGLSATDALDGPADVDATEY